ncbi:hypothetical protein HZB90_00390 [archaeon]|nr:hypothetical protein [archaeon]
MKIAKSRKAMTWEQIILAILAVAVLAAVLYFVFGPSGKTAGIIKKGLADCNGPAMTQPGKWNRCACFYQDRICPEDCNYPTPESVNFVDGCPPNTADCSNDERFEQALKASKDSAKGVDSEAGKKGYFGECCRGCASKSD